MGRQQTAETRIALEQVQAYLRRTYPDAVIEAMRPLGQETQAGLKSFGYGRPLRVTFTTLGARRDVVVRTMSPDPFGHDRRSDRGGAMLDAFDTFNQFPRHVRALDIGAFHDDGSMLPIGRGEIFLVTEYVEGDLYARDLQDLTTRDTARPLDLQRAEALAQFLAETHRVVAEPERYRRHVRDTLGGGEGILGLCDSYPADTPGAPRQRLLGLATQALTWRWKLYAHEKRARRTHGDFHPFNILFRQGTDFSVLDCSRGGCGEPADDVTCLAVNYLFFALSRRPRFDGALRELWDRFWQTYLDASGDSALLTVAPLYFAWRLLVLASPTWYPNLEVTVRDRLLTFAERLLAAERFEAFTVDRWL
ncbi:MAG: aminoglycoside phosphotransferase family protein [Deltaproteobacteria bacterium]|nr:aminoglycoside phosphotransferase family protein [Deltaproteobacteria bacterium]